MLFRSLRLFMPGWLRALADVLAVVAPGVGSTSVTYRSQREEGLLHIRGKSQRWSSHARINLAGGNHEIDFSYGGQTTTIDISVGDTADKETP